MSSELPFPEPEETQALLQDVLAFLEDDAWSDAAPTSSTTASKRHPDYERCRRDKKKTERETLRSQIAQFETQLELLQLQKPIQNSESKWNWVHAATQEEEKRRKAEEFNRQLKGILIQQLNAANKLQNIVRQEAVLTQRVQAVMSACSPLKTLIPKVTFTSLEAITVHLKGMISRLRSSADSEFSLTMEDANSGALMSSANVKNDDPIAGPCIELRSATPLSCSYEDAVPLMWNMLLDKKVLGSHSEFYTMKSQQLTQSSAEFGYSIHSGVPDEFEALDGVTLFEKTDKVNQTILLWASTMVARDGKPFCRSQGCLSISRLSSNPQEESVVRSFSRLSGKPFGVSGYVDTLATRKKLFASKIRLEHAQLRIMERADLQIG